MASSSLPVSRGQLIAVGLISGTLLMTELALTRIFSVVMYYHFAFLAISIALFGLSASGVFAYVARRRLDRQPTDTLLAVAVRRLRRLHARRAVRARAAAGRPQLLARRTCVLMLTIYALAALPFFTGGLVITLAISRLASRINAVYAADLLGAAAGCLVLIPLLDRLGAPGVVLTAAALALTAAVLFAPAGEPRAVCRRAARRSWPSPLAGQLSGVAVFDVVDTKGHQGDRVLFSKWNSFSRIGVYERTHGDWSLSPTYTGRAARHALHGHRLGGLDADPPASTPDLLERPVSALRADRRRLSAEGSRPGFTALVIGPGGGRDLVSALVFGAGHVDGVEINPIIANDVMRGQFREFSGGIYTHPRVRIADRRRPELRAAARPNRYDVIQASLVDTWAATAAGAYTLTENTLYTVEAFNDYLDHLTDDGMLTITRWVFDGLRLVSLAQAACERAAGTSRSRLAIVQHDRVATFLLKKSPFTPAEIATLRDAAGPAGVQRALCAAVAGEPRRPLRDD